MLAANKVSQLFVKSALQNSRNMSAISGPPQDKISLAEKLIHGTAIFVGMLAVPGWVLVNIKNYRAQA